MENTFVENIKKTFNAFVSDRQALEAALDSSTKSSWGGGHYVVELFPDGSYRVIPGNDMGTKYFSPGIVLTLPSLSDDDWGDCVEAEDRFYDNAEEALKESFDIVMGLRGY